MDRKTYMRDVYSKYWSTARDEIYGFTKYDKNLCDYIVENVPKGGRILEVAIGTGYPFGDFLQKADYSVFGIDISPELVEKCKKTNPNIDCRVGDAENLEYSDDYFDCTYCFNSTWYFPNLNKAIGEMLRVTRKGGLVIFDIENRNNRYIKKTYRKHILVVYIKNMLKKVLRLRGTRWSAVVHSTPTYPESIYEFLKERANFQVMVVKEDGGIEARSENGSFKNFQKLVFAVKK